jgi:hypothetical protein
VVVIIPAAHPDLLIALEHARPRGLQELEAFKRSVVTQLGPTWDFFNAAPALQKRADFSDASHADDALGRRMLATMTRTGPPVGMLLTVDTIDAQLIQQQAWYEGFKTREKRMSTLIASKEKWAAAEEEAFQAQVRKFVRR